MNERPKADVAETLLESIPFLEDDPKWGGAVERVQRNLTFPNGEARKFVDVRIRVGTRWLILPRNGLDEIISAITAIKGSASFHRAVSVEETPEKKDFRASPRRRLLEVEQHRSNRRFREYEE